MAIKFSHIHCVASSDPARRAIAIAQIKKNSNIQSRSLSDSGIFYAKEISLSVLQDSLLQYSFMESKFVLIKDTDSLSAEAKEFFAKNLSNIPQTTIVVCEFEQDLAQLKPKTKDSTDLFYRLLTECSVSSIAPAVEEPGFQDFIAKVKRNDLSGSILLAEKLLENKNPAVGPQILGYLVSKVSYMTDQKAKIKALECLWLADRQLKEKDLPAKLVLEKLLTQLLTFR